MSQRTTTLRTVVRERICYIRPIFPPIPIAYVSWRPHAPAGPALPLPLPLPLPLSMHTLLPLMKPAHTPFALDDTAPIPASTVVTPGGHSNSIPHLHRRPPPSPSDRAACARYRLARKAARDHHQFFQYSACLVSSQRKLADIHMSNMESLTKQQAQIEELRLQAEVNTVTITALLKDLSRSLSSSLRDHSSPSIAPLD